MSLCCNSFKGYAYANIITIEINNSYRASADAELQMNIKDSEIFKLPSGQEIEKDILFIHIQTKASY